MGLRWGTEGAGIEGGRNLGEVGLSGVWRGLGDRGCTWGSGNECLGT